MTDASIMSELHYRDPQRALVWLEQAFGFETELLVTDADDRLVFARVGWNGGAVGVVGEDPPKGLSPASLNGAGTHALQVRFDQDIDAHLAKARAAGAVILREPQSAFYGDRTYIAADIEGHVWMFGQRISDAGGPPPEGWTVRFPNRGKAPA